MSKQFNLRISVYKLKFLNSLPVKMIIYRYKHHLLSLVRFVEGIMDIEVLIMSRLYVNLQPKRLM